MNQSSIKIVTWNVNSINARREHVLRYLQMAAPDVLMMQEIKSLEFPAMAFEALGYRCLTSLQKTYNGVAILSRRPMQLIVDRLPGDAADEQARFLDVQIEGGPRVINIYLPNGNPVYDDAGGYNIKYSYKLSWMRRLYDYLNILIQAGVPFIIGGDFNVIPEDKDCYDPELWKEDALFRIETRKVFRSLEHLGLTDGFRVHNSGGHHYSFWDYQGGAWQNDKGIRIDHFLLSPYWTDRMVSCVINREPRGWEKASDHTTVEIVLGGS